MTRKTAGAAFTAAAVLAVVGAFLLSRSGRLADAVAVVAQNFGGPEIGGLPPMPRQILRSDIAEVRLEVVAQDLTIPWAIAFASDGRMFFTERPGRIQVMRRGSPSRRYADLARVVHQGEGGLMGLALHPQFPRTPYLYVMYTSRAVDGRPVNRVSRYRDLGEKPGAEEILFDNIAAAANHNGGAIAFGPDGMLYVGTGDAAQPKLSQDLNSPNGKILRLTPEGKVPADNPTPGSPVYAHGFRNVTGLAWHPTTHDLWAASHGPSGEFPGLGNRDSVYVVKQGANHGWPLVVGTTTRPGIVSPALYYPESAVPPGGALFYTGDLLPRFRGNFFLTTLRSEHLQRIVVGPGNRIQAIERWWPQRYGRLRAIAQGPDGAIYFSTSSLDGRQDPPIAPGADFIYRIVPAG